MFPGIMESGKRKQPEDGNINVTTEKEVTEEEVEEFFAILRRIHVAVKYFENSNGPGMAAKRWKPSFEREDFQVEANDVKIGKKKKEEGVEENKGLDLNVGPETEDSSV